MLYSIMACLQNRFWLYIVLIYRDVFVCLFRPRSAWLRPFLWAIMIYHTLCLAKSILLKETLTWQLIHTKKQSREWLYFALLLHCLPKVLFVFTFILLEITDKYFVVTDRSLLLYYRHSPENVELLSTLGLLYMQVNQIHITLFLSTS